MVALLGPLFSLVFHSPTTAWVYSIVGLASVFKGFGHLDLKVRMRLYDYTAEAVTGLLSQIAWTGVSVVIAAVYHDYRSMAFGLVGYALSYVVVSHAFRTTPWRLGWDRAIVWDSIRYGRPLALNGLLYSFISLGDRTVIGARINVEQLAHYTALSTSAFLPRAAIGKFLNSIFVPHFVNNHSVEAKARAANLWFLALMIIAGTFGIGYVAFGQMATVIVFGNAYAVDQKLVCLVAVLGTIRYLACLPSPPALALARNDILVRFTLLSASGIVVGGLLVGLWAPRLELLLSGMILGEVVGMLWCVPVIVRLTGADPIYSWLLFAIPLGETALQAFASLSIVQATFPARCVLFLFSLTIHVLASLVCMRAIDCHLPDVVRAIFPSRALAKLT